MNSKLTLEGRIYMLTVDSILTTDVSTNLCQLLFRATLKDRLDSCLSLLSELRQNERTFKIIHSLSTGGTHSQVEASITSPTSPPYVVTIYCAF